MCIGSTTGGYTKTRGGAGGTPDLVPPGPPPQTATQVVEPEARRRLIGRPTQLESQRRPLTDRIGL